MLKVSMVPTIVGLLTIVITLWGGVNFAVTKINQHDGLMTRVARLESNEQIIATIRDELRTVQHTSAQNAVTNTQLVSQLNRLTDDTIDMRVRMERLTAIVEKK